MATTLTDVVPAAGLVRRTLIGRTYLAHGQHLSGVVQANLRGKIIPASDTLYTTNEALLAAGPAPAGWEVTVDRVGVHDPVYPDDGAFAVSRVLLSIPEGAAALTASATYDVYVYDETSTEPSTIPVRVRAGMGITGDEIEIDSVKYVIDGGMAAAAFASSTHTVYYYPDDGVATVGDVEHAVLVADITVLPAAATYEVLLQESDTDTLDDAMFVVADTEDGRVLHLYQDVGVEDDSARSLDGKTADVIVNIRGDGAEAWAKLRVIAVTKPAVTVTRASEFVALGGGAVLAGTVTISAHNLYGNFATLALTSGDGFALGSRNEAVDGVTDPADGSYPLYYSGGTGAVDLSTTLVFSVQEGKPDKKRTFTDLSHDDAETVTFYTPLSGDGDGNGAVFVGGTNLAVDVDASDARVVTVGAGVTTIPAVTIQTSFTAPSIGTVTASYAFTTTTFGSRDGFLSVPVSRTVTTGSVEGLEDATSLTSGALLLDAALPDPDLGTTNFVEVEAVVTLTSSVDGSTVDFTITPKLRVYRALIVVDDDELSTALGVNDDYTRGLEYYVRGGVFDVASQLTVTSDNYADILISASKTITKEPSTATHSVQEHTLSITDRVGANDTTDFTLTWSAPLELSNLSLSGDGVVDLGEGVYAVTASDLHNVFVSFDRQYGWIDSEHSAAVAISAGDTSSNDGIAIYQNINVLSAIDAETFTPSGADVVSAAVETETGLTLAGSFATPEGWSTRYTSRTVTVTATRTIGDDDVPQGDPITCQLHVFADLVPLADVVQVGGSTVINIPSTIANTGGSIVLPPDRYLAGGIVTAAGDYGVTIAPVGGASHYALSGLGTVCVAVPYNTGEAESYTLTVSDLRTADVASVNETFTFDPYVVAGIDVPEDYLPRIVLAPHIFIGMADVDSHVIPAGVADGALVLTVNGFTCYDDDVPTVTLMKNTAAYSGDAIATDDEDWVEVDTVDVDASLEDGVVTVTLSAVANVWKALDATKVYAIRMVTTISEAVTGEWLFDGETWSIGGVGAVRPGTTTVHAEAVLGLQGITLTPDDGDPYDTAGILTNFGSREDGDYKRVDFAGIPAYRLMIANASGVFTGLVGLGKHYIGIVPVDDVGTVTVDSLSSYATSDIQFYNGDGDSLGSYITIEDDGTTVTYGEDSTTTLSNVQAIAMAAGFDSTDTDDFDYVLVVLQRSADSAAIRSYATRVSIGDDETGALLTVAQTWGDLAGTGFRYDITLVPPRPVTEGSGNAALERASVGAVNQWPDLLALVVTGDNFTGNAAADEAAVFMYSLEARQYDSGDDWQVIASNIDSDGVFGTPVNFDDVKGVVNALTLPERIGVVTSASGVHILRLWDNSHTLDYRLRVQDSVLLAANSNQLTTVGTFYVADIRNAYSYEQYDDLHVPVADNFTVVRTTLKDFAGTSATYPNKYTVYSTAVTPLYVRHASTDDILGTDPTTLYKFIENPGP